MVYPVNGYLVYPAQASGWRHIRPSLAGGLLVATIETVFAGDNATTGSAIARQAGILPAGCRVFRPADQDDLLTNLEQLGAPPAAFQR